MYEVKVNENQPDTFLIQVMNRPMFPGTMYLVLKFWKISAL